MLAQKLDQPKFVSGFRGQQPVKYNPLSLIPMLLIHSVLILCYVGSESVDALKPSLKLIKKGDDFNPTDGMAEVDPNNSPVGPNGAFTVHGAYNAQDYYDKNFVKDRVHTRTDYKTFTRDVVLDGLGAPKVERWLYTHVPTIANLEDSVKLKVTTESSFPKCHTTEEFVTKCDKMCINSDGGTAIKNYAYEYPNYSYPYQGLLHNQVGCSENTMITTPSMFFSKQLCAVVKFCHKLRTSLCTTDMMKIKYFDSTNQIKHDKWKPDGCVKYNESIQVDLDNQEKFEKIKAGDFMGSNSYLHTSFLL